MAALEAAISCGREPASSSANAAWAAWTSAARWSTSCFRSDVSNRATNCPRSTNCPSSTGRASTRPGILKATWASTTSMLPETRT